MANITLSHKQSAICRKKISVNHPRGKTDKRSKGYNTLGQLVSMVFCQFSNYDSLRDISNWLNSANGNSNQPGICRAPLKSTVAYQNAQRDSPVFRDILYETYRHSGHY